jgi:putative oxidoreductase
MLNKIFGEYASWHLLFLRFGVGLIFLIHGLGKLFNVGPAASGISGLAGFFVSLGIPIAIFFAWVVALVEVFGGLFILLGLFTRYSAILLSVDMVVAILLVHLSKGFSIANGGYEFALLLLLGAITLFFSGAGKKWVLEKALFKKEF